MTVTNSPDPVVTCVILLITNKIREKYQILFRELVFIGHLTAFVRILSDKCGGIEQKSNFDALYFSFLDVKRTFQAEKHAFQGEKRTFHVRKRQNQRRK